ncbi:hypothetical protein C8J57DRAFT_1717275 [Mycena rebaudengoi]|nr:hypothetical protein C8J57DRAFT_1717275 [Mycena rebaudengoi]
MASYTSPAVWSTVWPGAIVVAGALATPPPLVGEDAWRGVAGPDQWSMKLLDDLSTNLATRNAERAGSSDHKWIVGKPPGDNKVQRHPRGKDAILEVFTMCPYTQMSGTLGLLAVGRSIVPFGMVG